MKNKLCSGFTLLEVIIACALCLMMMWSSRYLYGLYQHLLFSSAVDQILCSCQYLAHCARHLQRETSFTLIPPASYRMYDGRAETVCTLPAGIGWGVCGEVYGPPSRPTTRITMSAVGGVARGGSICFTWQSTGAQAPGTIYLSMSSCSLVGAVTLPRAALGVATCWILQKGSWNRRCA